MYSHGPSYKTRPVNLPDPYETKFTAKTAKCISHIEQTCQQGTVVQDTRSTETSITVPGQTKTRGLTSDW